MQQTVGMDSRRIAEAHPKPLRKKGYDLPPRRHHLPERRHLPQNTCNPGADDTLLIPYRTVAIPLQTSQKQKGVRQFKGDRPPCHYPDRAVAIGAARQRTAALPHDCTAFHRSILSRLRIHVDNGAR